MLQEKPIINEEEIFELLSRTSYSQECIEETLTKAETGNGLDIKDIPALCSIQDPILLQRLFSAAKALKETIYGKRLVLFAPLYISNFCNNECLYCAFRTRNKEIQRRALTQEEIQQETIQLLKQGQKRILLVAGESYPEEGFSYILNSIHSIYQASFNGHHIRRINVNIAPLHSDEFRMLQKAKIGTYQLFQETYHSQTYASMHPGGKKKDYHWRITAMDRALEAGLSDVGIGVLFGLYDWRFEIIALMQHIRHLEQRFGIGPHTISVPRLEPALSSAVAQQPPFPVEDLQFKKLIAILRLAVPYTGIILSTRENSSMRREAFELGISQISAGSRTNPGGYSRNQEDSSQFSLGDHRSLQEVIRDILSLGYIPSFCTGCYRLGRVGKDFMDQAKPGLIKLHCQPNALLTLKEYLIDFADSETRQLGEALILSEMQSIPDAQRKAKTEYFLRKIEQGKRDIYF